MITQRVLLLDKKLSVGLVRKEDFGPQSANPWIVGKMETTIVELANIIGLRRVDTVKAIALTSFLDDYRNWFYYQIISK